MWKKLTLALLTASLCAGFALAQDATPVPAPTEEATAVPDPAHSVGQPGIVMGESSVTGGDEAALRAFIIRYLGGTGSNIVNVMIGSLPEGLPFEVTTLADATNVTTIVRPSGENSYTDVTYDSASTPQAVLDFYKQAFAGADWRIASENVTPPTGFTQDSSAYASFCYQDGAITVNVNAYDSAITPTTVAVGVQQPGDEYTCASTTEGPMTDPMYALIPALAQPEGVTVAQNMGGGLSYYAADGRSASTSAVLETRLPLADLLTAYDAQLAAAGWTAVSSEATALTGISTWTLTNADGEAFQGTLLLVADGDGGAVNALLYIEE